MSDDFFGDLGKSISRVTQKAVGRTGELFETTKINAQISGEQREIEKLYAKIGAVVYRKIANGTMEADEDIAPIVDDIRAHAGQLASRRRALAGVKTMRVCPACGELIATDVAFCPKCGTPVVVDNTPAALTDADEEDDDEYIETEE